MAELQSYVTAADGKTLSANYDYKQSFHHKIKNNVAEYVVVKDFLSVDDYTRTVMVEVLKHLRNFVFASEEQLCQLLQMKGIDPSGLPGLLTMYSNNRVINYFALSAYELSEIPADAFRVYCLDQGGVQILAHFSTYDEDVVSWLSTDCIRPVELVMKYLTTGQFYLALAEARGSNLAFFKPVHDVNIGRRSMRFSAEFQIMQGYSPQNFILESVRSWDVPVEFSRKVNDKMSVFIGSKFWERYYKMPPTYIFLVESTEDALQVGKIFQMRTGCDQFRIITDEQVKKGFDEVIMYKYIPSDDPNSDGELKAVRSGMFSKQKK